MKNNKRRDLFEIKCASEWLRVKVAAIQPSGWLHYELRDGTIGLAQPKNWREIYKLPLRNAEADE